LGKIVAHVSQAVWARWARQNLFIAYMFVVGARPNSSTAHPLG